VRIYYSTARNLEEYFFSTLLLLIDLPLRRTGVLQIFWDLMRKEQKAFKCYPSNQNNPYFSEYLKLPAVYMRYEKQRNTSSVEWMRNQYKKKLMAEMSVQRVGAVVI
jgi:vacuolar-type H+-ATPase catalytic subunit A/Vma1